MEMNVEKNKIIENFNKSIPSKNYDRPKTTSECGIWVACKQMTEDVLVKLNPGLLWQRLHLTRRGLFLLAHWTWN